MTPLRTLLLSALLLIAGTASAHGAVQHIVEGKFLLNLSSAPIAPYAGQEQQNILTLSDVATNSLIGANSIFTVDIKKEDDEQSIYHAESLVATGGLLSVSFRYPEAGEYEFYTTVKLPGSEKIYEPEHFMIQVNEAPVPPSPPAPSPLPGAAGALVFGLIIGYFMRIFVTQFIRTA